MFFGNRCGGCGICGIFSGCGRRRRGCCGWEQFGCCDERFRFDRFDRFDERCGCGERFERGLERRDFDGFFPEAKFVRVERECRCSRCC